MNAEVAVEKQTGNELVSSIGSVDISALAGKYLTFKLDDEHYGLEILRVQEIIGILPVTPVPRTPEYIRGVINLRGKVIVVTDLRLKLGMKSCEDTVRTCIIVVQIQHKDRMTTMGLIVDEVSEVMEIEADQLEPTPEFGNSINVDFLFGIGKVASKVIMLLDANKVLSANDLDTISEASSR